MRRVFLDTNILLDLAIERDALVLHSSNNDFKGVSFNGGCLTYK